MSFLKRAIRDGIRQGIGDAVGGAIRQAIEPKATEIANKAAQQFDQMAQTQTQKIPPAAGGLEGALGNLQRAAENYATEVSKNVKVCPGCGEPAPADKTFCPHCGGKLPETTMAQDALCPACGKQNPIGMKFCDACGAKLPAALAEERVRQEAWDTAMADWEDLLPQYPKWEQGGTSLFVEEYEPDTENHHIYVHISFPKGSSGELPLRRYREVLQQNGFRTAGQYPDICHLYKMVDGVCFHVDSEHAFESGMDNVDLYFNIQQPRGGFDYVKPEPKPQCGIQDLGDMKEGFRDMKDGLKDMKKFFKF